MNQLYQRIRIGSPAAAVAAGLITAAITLSWPSTAAAEGNPTPITIPALATEGVASPYPSTLTVTAAAGPTHRAQPIVVLHGVTHPCPEDLAILLVHNHTDGYLLMSNAGGCRALQGTSVHFRATSDPFPNGQIAEPYEGSIYQGASNYDAVPVFPAPAPAGPYTLGLPPATTNINGSWSLYIVDTRNNARGIVAGGWSIDYSPTAFAPAQQTSVVLPGAGTSGPGAAYPITFDLTTVPAAATVTRVYFFITVSHPRPEDMRLVLQSPAGTSVVLMANAGGGFPLAPGSTLRFLDGVNTPVPDNGPVTSDTAYLPGGAYGVPIKHTLPAPAPQPPYETAFAAFTGEPAAGIWRLWAFDSSDFMVGVIESAELRVTTLPDTESAITSPAGIGTIPSTTPFVRVELSTLGFGESDIASWRVTNGPAEDFYAAGALTRVPGTGLFVGDVPVKQGVNEIQMHLGAIGGPLHLRSVQIGVDEFIYSLAEGATGTFFDLDVTVANFGDPVVPITFEFLPEGGAPVPLDTTVDGHAPRQVQVDSVVPGAALSTIVHSPQAVPLAVERTMIWDERGYGGHGGTAADPATRWLFAEGAQGFFNTFILLANNNDTAANVTLSFLLEGGGLVAHAVSVPAKSRWTVFAGDIPALVNQSFGLDVTSTLPIIAERAMYLPGARLFEGGHGSAGVNRPETQWYLAEGATGPFFETFVLLSNPNAAAANVTLTYLLPDGTTIPHLVVVAANGRLTINVETVDPLLANVPVSTAIAADRGIVVERAMYWPDITQGWQEAHNSFGLTTTGTRWGLADGRVGGPRGFETYVLLANPNPTPADVHVRFLKAGKVLTVRRMVAPTSRVNIQASQLAELGEGQFSVEVRVLNDQPIAVEKAMYWNADGVTWAGGTNVTATRLPPP